MPVISGAWSGTRCPWHRQACRRQHRQWRRQRLGCSPTDTPPVTTCASPIRSECNLWYPGHASLRLNLLELACARHLLVVLRPPTNNLGVLDVSRMCPERCCARLTHHPSQKALIVRVRHDALPAAHLQQELPAACGCSRRHSGSGHGSGHCWRTLERRHPLRAIGCA